MTSRAFFRASMVAIGVSAALAANSAWAQQAGTPAPVKQGDEQSGEEMGVITVTGSRTITEAVLSPTPITSVEISQISVTTPSDVTRTSRPPGMVAADDPVLRVTAERRPLSDVDPPPF